MTKPYRTRLDIVIDILQLCKAPHLYTRILGINNLSPQQGKQYLNDLIGRGYLEQRSENQTQATSLRFHAFYYCTTDEGSRALQILEKAKQDIEGVIG